GVCAPGGWIGVVGGEAARGGAAVHTEGGELVGGLAPEHAEAGERRGVGVVGEKGHERAIDAEVEVVSVAMLARKVAEGGAERVDLRGGQTSRQVIERRRAAGRLVAQKLDLAGAEGTSASDGFAETPERRAGEDDICADAHPRAD